MTSTSTLEAVRTDPRRYAPQAAGGILAGGILLGSKSGLRKPASLAHARLGTGYADTPEGSYAAPWFGCHWVLVLPYLMTDAVDTHWPSRSI